MNIKEYNNSAEEVEVKKTYSLADFINFPEKDVMERAKEFGLFAQYIDQYQHNTVHRVAYSASTPIRLVKDNYTGEMREMIYMASNDYLSLSTHPKVKQAGIDAIKKYGTGAGSAPLIGGTTDCHVELEKKIADFYGCESAIVYATGFGANVSTLMAILDKSDLAVVDSLAHASLIDGCKNTNMKMFRHNEPEFLESILKRYAHDYRTKMIIIDGVYSMDGDIAKLPEILALAKKYGAYLMLDEAHAMGILGENGRGTAEHFGLMGQIDIICGTFSKSTGAIGGFVAAKGELINLLRFYSRGYMFSAAMPPATAASISKAIDVIQNEPKIRQRLWRNIRYFKERLLKLGFDIGKSETGSFPIIIGDDFIVKEMCKELNDMNIYVNPVVFPAVSKKSSRLRLSLMADHSLKNLDTVLEALAFLGKKHNIIPNSAEVLFNSLSIRKSPRYISCRTRCKHEARVM